MRHDAKKTYTATHAGQTFTAGSLLTLRHFVLSQQADGTFKLISGHVSLTNAELHSGMGRDPNVVIVACRPV